MIVSVGEELERKKAWLSVEKGVRKKNIDTNSSKKGGHRRIVKIIYR